MQKERSIQYLLILLLGLFLVLGGCKAEEDESDVSSSGSSTAVAEMIVPSVDSTSDAAVNTNITVEFDRAMTPGTVNATTFIVKERDSTGDAVVGVFSYSADNMTFTFDPSSDLDTDTTYDVQITSSIKDSSKNLFSGATWSFVTSESSGLYMPFNFGSLYDSCSQFLIETVIVGNSSSDITIKVFNEKCEPIATSSETIADISESTTLNVVSLNEKETYTQNVDGQEKLVMRKSVLKLSMYSSGGNYYWSSTSTEVDHVLGPAFRQLKVDADPNTILIRNKKDGTAEMLEFGAGLDTKVFAFLRNQPAENNFYTPAVERGKVLFNYACDGTVCSHDIYTMMKIPATEEYLSFELSAGSIDLNDYLYFYLTDVSFADNYTNSAGVGLSAQADSIQGMSGSSTTTDTGSEWTTKINNCEVNSNGSVVAYIGNTYAAFVQLVSSIEDAVAGPLDTVDVKIEAYEKISGEWTLQENQTFIVEEGTPLAFPSSLTVTVDDYGSCSMGDASQLTVNVSNTTF